MGYIEKRKRLKRKNTIISLLIISLTVLSLLPFLASINWKFDFFGELRFYYILIATLIFIYCICLKKWTFFTLSILIIIANVAILYAYSGRPFNQNIHQSKSETISMLLYTLDQQSENYQDLQYILDSYIPDIALIFSPNPQNNQNYSNKNYPYAKNTITENNKLIYILSKYPFINSGTLSDKKGIIAPWITINLAEKPLSIVSVFLDSPWKNYEKYQNARQNILALAEFSKSRDEPTILAGNFSATAASELLQPLSFIADLRPIEGLQPVYPSFLPFFLRFNTKHVYAHPGIVVDNVKQISTSENLTIPLMIKVKPLKELQ